jgi:hypothetical protein
MAKKISSAKNWISTIISFITASVIIIPAQQVVLK